jgi:hypothetical protein
VSRYSLNTLIDHVDCLKYQSDQIIRIKIVAGDGLFALNFSDLLSERSSLVDNLVISACISCFVLFSAAPIKFALDNS